MNSVKRPTFVVIVAAVAATASGLLWRSFHQQPAPPPPVISRADQLRLDNIARQKKDGIIPPKFGRSADRAQQEKLATQQAMPTRDTSLALLDLNRVPTEAELIKAGQLQEPLSPTGPADPEKIADPIMKTMQGRDNQLFGQAMNAWNRREYTEALPLFMRHLKEFPRSPWAAESHLHLGLASLQQGYPPGCAQEVEAVLKDTAKGTDAYQKALLLKASLFVQGKRPDKAAEIFAEAMTTETDARRRSTAASWLVALSQRPKS